MINNNVPTRVTMKYDTLANWNSSQLILERGEMAIAEIAPAGKNTAPVIGIKIGDGTKTFSQLYWVQAIAG